MTPERWQRAKAILAEALDQPQSGRRSYIVRVCGSDSELFEELERLLEADAAPDVIPPPDPFGAKISCTGPIDSRAEQADRRLGPRESEHPPTMSGRLVGKFRIVRLIGVGGMGAVYEAQQDFPSRAVALKLVRWGVASPESLRRFKFEAEVLARLQHPGIAQIFEAGIQVLDGQSLPYFAMELVPDAHSLLEHATACELSIRGRIDIFIRVCEAVQHGHLRGVIHRDLKPANILVSQDDPESRPKIIDFGVARLTDSDFAVRTQLTDARQLIGTIQYMSPEQCSENAADLDVRSDVYSLGVVLYELLTGAMPYDLSGSHALAAPSIIRERTPHRPSSIAPSVRGDLQIILLKALEKDRERRYQSAEAFADDLRRYLSGDPIRARPASATYQARMFVRRHRPMVAGVVGTILALLVGLVASLVLYQAARRARDIAQAATVEAQRQATIASEQEDRAKRVAAFLISTVESVGADSSSYAPGAPGWDDRFYPLVAKTYRQRRTANPPGSDATLLDVLTSAAGEIDAEFATAPLVKADVAVALAKGMSEAGGSLALRRALLEKALSERRRVLGDAHADTIEILYELGSSYASFNFWSGAEPYYVDAIAACPGAFGPLSPQERELSRSLVTVLLSDPTQARRAVRIQQAMYDRCVLKFGADDPATLIEEVVLVRALGQVFRVDEAEAHGEHAYRGLFDKMGSNHYSTGEAAGTLAELLADHRLRTQGDKIRELYERAMSCMTDQFGPHSSHVRAIQKPFQDELIRLGDYPANERIARAMLASIEQSAAQNGYERMGVQCRLARAIIWNRGDLSEAERLARDATDRIAGRAEPINAFFLGTLADTLRAQGRVDEARELIDETVHAMPTALKSTAGDVWTIPSWIRGYVHGVRAQCLADAGRLDEAAGAFDEARESTLEECYDQLGITVMLLRRGAAFFDRTRDVDRASRWHNDLQCVALEDGEFELLQRGSRPPAPP